MKKEAISVLKPHNGKSLKNKNQNNPKKNVSKVEKRVTSPRVARKKPKIVNVQQVNIENTLKQLKTSKTEVRNEAKTENFKKNLKNKSNHEDKMAAAVNEKTRVLKKKSLKTETEAPIQLKKQKTVVKQEANVKTQETKDKSVKNQQKRKSKVKKEVKLENVGHLKMTKKHVLQTILSIQKLAQKQEESKKTLLPTESNPLLLQVECIKIAKTPRRQIRPYLPHQLAGPLDDVALFVPDLEKGRRKDYEKTVDHWETKLREKGVDCIKEIIPINRVKTEYSQFEMQRKLAMSFDYFLADGRICGHLTHLLGKTFFKRRHPPTPVKLIRDNLKEELNFALHKTCMEVHSYGNTHVMPVGTFAMDEKKLAENVWAASEELAKEYPGGLANIRSLRLKTNTGPAIPIYVNLGSKNDVPVPVVKPKRPRAYETVEGELTTVPGGARVKLTPEGRIHIKRLKDYGDAEEEEEEDDEEEEAAEEEVENKWKVESEGEEEKPEGVKSEEDDDDEE